jgi:hypothetical protein
MKKIAIFTEGKTEMEFVDLLIRSIAGEINITVARCDLIGQDLISHKFLSVVENGNLISHCLLVDCHGDEGGRRVKKKVKEHLKSLHENGYEKVIGLWDLRPNFSYLDLARVRNELYTYIPTKYCKCSLHLSVMEIESWFLQDRSHFTKIKPELTEEKIQSRLPLFADPNLYEKIETPAELLNDIYGLVGLSYKKTGNSIKRTISALDFTFLYMADCRSDSLRKFVSDVEVSLILKNRI